MADMVNHRGLFAFQGVYNNHVEIIGNEKVVKRITTTTRQSEDDLKRLIDEYIEDRSGIENG